MRPDILFENFEMLADAPNGVPKLRELILQMAVQGKLVPQDPNDQPAKDLIGKIQTKKEQLIKKGKIKKTKPLPDIGLDEIPFELPEGWEWIGLNDVFDVRDGTHDTPQYVAKGIPLITSKNISSGVLDFSNIKYISIEDHKIIKQRSGVDKYDILLAMIGSIGNPVIVGTDLEFSIKNVALFKYYALNLSNPKYLHLYLIYATKKMRTDAAGAVQAFVSLKFLRNFPFSMPPLNEQKRIVAKVEQLITLCDELEARKEKRKETRIALNDAALDTLLNAENKNEFSKHWQRIASNFDLLYDTPETVNKLRQAILQLAVQGKLVPQDPNDLHASVLLEKIKIEKEILVKETRIKNTKNLPPIKPDQIPYEIPESWNWARIRHVTYDLGQKKPDKEFTYIDVTSINKERGIISEAPKILSAEEAPSRARKIVEYDTVIYSTVRPYLLNIAIIDEHFIPEPIVSTAFSVLHPYTGIVNRYLYYYLRSHPFIKYVENAMTGMAYPAINDTKMNVGPIPIPPTSEQKRIVTKVDQLMALCDELEAKLSKSQKNCDKLLSAIVNSIENRESNGSSNKGSKSNNLHNIKTEKDVEVVESAKEILRSASPERPPSQRKKAPRPQASFERPDALRAYRKAVFRQNDIDEITLLRSAGRHLGIMRLSESIHDELKSYIRTAISRKIIARNGDGFSPGSPTIHHYRDDYLIKALRSSIQSGYEYPRDYLINEVSKNLGFDRVSDDFSERMKSIFRVAIRQGQLYRNGSYVGKL